VNDVIKHQSLDSFSRSAHGYMAALVYLAEKHKIFSENKFQKVKKYLIMRSLVGSLLRFQMKIFWKNLCIYRNSTQLKDENGLSVCDYFDGKKVRKIYENRIIKHI
jgi:hypothetical protein